MASSSSEEQKPEDQISQEVLPPQPTVKECVHKTKLVEFLGRTTPIVLQNDNGPCPLLAICNILLLRNNLNLTPDTTEVSQEKLLSLVAERLIDSNSNIDDKDEGYAENIQQNIADAIDLLPRLATGIDVNIKFRRIDDFEFTRECAIFDLLDIPLYHGWIVDPQDCETANAIGSKSYNSLMEELVALETRIEAKYENSSEEDCVDFAAATTATLGVPSPCLSKARSFDESPRISSDHRPNALKGDLEEETELLRALEISKSEFPSSLPAPSVADVNDTPVYVSDTVKNSHISKPNLYELDHSDAEKNTGTDSTHLKVVEEPVVNLTSDANERNDLDFVIDAGENSGGDTSGLTENSFSLSPGRRILPEEEQIEGVSGGSEKFDKLDIFAIVHENEIKMQDSRKDSPCLSAPNPDMNSDTSSGRVPSETLASTESEPLYEGEDCIIMDPRTLDNEVREPVYEGEGVLANQADKSTTLESRSSEGLTLQAGELVKTFLKSNASQLTINGLFCLQAGLKERELCVFFRNNHFSTMFKFNGELYLLATDQGYITQSDLVWEKLNEVNGDSLFMTGNFKEFKVENNTSDSWSEHNAMSSTADYIASIDSAAQMGLDINPDLQLAIALQQQEIEQQQQQQRSTQPQQQQNQQQSVSGSSRLITGPNVPRSNIRNHPSSYQRPEPKSKEKCTLM